MKTRLVKITLFFLLVIVVLVSVSLFLTKPADIGEQRAAQVVALNEIGQLAKTAAAEQDADQLAFMEEKIAALQEELRGGEATAQSRPGLLIFLLGGAGAAYFLTVFGYTYFAVLRPFEKMKHYANRIAQGDFDLPLQYERSNYFGEFTWAFDNMRREITKARACEREAIENNKTVIATLSHDIKTPIASIQAYAEGLEANLDGTPEKRAKYLGVILRKCKEVAQLTNDLFTHSLSDLDKLQLRPEPVELCGFLRCALEELSAERGDITFEEPGFEAVVLADRKRLLQITENLVNNARKYAKSSIEISAGREGKTLLVRFRDHGQGIPDEDMPFIFDKFYRGRNCGSEQGSGLGLYIVRYIMLQMDGQVRLHNHPDGLEVILTFPVTEGQK